MPRTDRRHGDRSDVFPLAAVGCDAEGPTLPVRGVPNAAERGACLRSASAPGVPIWAAPGWRRPSGALFGARAGGLDRRLGFGRRHPQHRLPSAVLYALQSEQAASVLAPGTAPGTKSRGYPFATTQTRPVSGITAPVVEMERKIAQIPAATPPYGRTQDANTTGPVGALLHETQLTGVLDGAKGTARSPGSGVRCPQTSATPISPGGT